MPRRTKVSDVGERLRKSRWTDQNLFWERSIPAINGWDSIFDRIRKLASLAFAGWALKLEN